MSNENWERPSQEWGEPNKYWRDPVESASGSPEEVVEGEAESASAPTETTSTPGSPVPEPPVSGSASTPYSPPETYSSPETAGHQVPEPLGVYEPPASDSYDPPQTPTGDQPPQATNTYQAPTTSSYQPPQAANSYQAPTSESYQPPQTSGSYQAPSDDHKSPTASNDYQSPQTSGDYQQPSASTSYQAPGASHDSQVPPPYDGSDQPLTAADGQHKQSESYSQYSGGHAAGGPAYAGFGKRFMGWLFDHLLPWFVIGFVSVMVALIVGAVSGAGGTRTYTQALVETILLVAWYAVLAHLSGTTGVTPGRKIAKTKLVAAQTGQPVGFGKTFLRYICHIVDCVICFVGWLFPLWDTQRQTLADKIVSTIVVEDQH